MSGRADRGATRLAGVGQVDFTLERVCRLKVLYRGVVNTIRMKKSLIGLCFGLILSGFALAQPLPKAGQTYESKSIDLTGDGKPEKVVLVAYDIDQEMQGYAGQLKVLTSQGQLLWQAPKQAKPGLPFAFGAWPYGVSGLQWLGDIDGDKKIELLSVEPVSDVRPFTFQRYRWEGKAFRSLGRKMLLESKPGSGRFLWRDPIEWDGVSPLSWAMTLSGDPVRCEVEVMSYGKNGEIKSGKAVMKGDGLGLTVTSWIRQMSSSQ